MTFDPTLIDRPLTALLPLRDRVAALVRPAGERLAKLSWVWQVALVWAVSRAYTAALVVFVAGHQGPNPWSPAEPDYFAYVNGWDAGYYEQIHDTGYPTTLPRDDSGQVVNNVWAFLPAYPLLVRAITSTTGASWPVAASILSALAALGFLLVTYRLFRLRCSAATSLTAVAAISLGTASPVLQFPYAESLGLMLLSSLLLLLATGRFLWAAGLVALLAFTRPWTAPVAMTCLVVAGLTWFAHRRDGLRVPGRVRWELAVLCATALAGLAAWPLIAGAATGEPAAYLLTEASWHGGHTQVPLMLFLRSFVIYFGFWPGLISAGLALVLIVAMMFSRPVLRLGGVLWAWVGSMVGYLVLIVPVNSSLIRLALPLFPLLLAATNAARSRAYRGLLLVVLAATQAAWLAVLWHWSSAGPQPAP